MELFNQYKADLQALIEEIEQKKKDSSNLNGDDRRHALREIENCFKEADELLDSMELSARSVPGKVEELLNQIKTYRNNIKNLKKDLQTLEKQADRIALLGGTDEEAVTTLEQRTAMLTNTDRLTRIGSDIMHSNQIGQEALRTGVATLQELQEQGERIQHSRAGLREINDRLDQAKRLMQRIWRGVLKNKGIQALIILLLIAMILLIIYLKWIHKPGAPYISTPTPNVQRNTTNS
jgi:chromosome segregation ATPase